MSSKAYVRHLHSSLQLWIQGQLAVVCAGDASTPARRHAREITTKGVAAGQAIMTGPGRPGKNISAGATTLARWVTGPRIYENADWQRPQHANVAHYKDKDPCDFLLAVSRTSSMVP